MRHFFIYHLFHLLFPVLLWVGFLPTTAGAIDLTENIQLHGFASLGYLHSRGNNFLADTKDGTFDMNEIGINLNVRLTENFRVGGQVLSWKMGDYGDNSLRFDWALIDYRPRDYFGVKAGKVKMPVGLYNTERDLDFLRPMIFLPQSIYDETRRDTWLAHYGGELYGNIEAGSLGDLCYQFYAGKIDYSSDSINSDAALKKLQSQLAANRNKTNPDPDLPVSITSYERENDYIAGAAIVFHPPIDQLRLGVTLTTMEDKTSTGHFDVGTYKIRNKFVVSLEYIWQEFTLAAEYSENDRQQTQFGQTVMDGPSQGWYVMLSYAPFEQVTLTVLYDEFHRLKNERYRQLAPGVIGSPSPWRKDWGFAVRWDPTPNWTLKGEWHAIDGTAFFMTFFNPDGIDRYWQYGAIKVSFNF